MTAVAPHPSKLVRALCALLLLAVSTALVMYFLKYVASSPTKQRITALAEQLEDAHRRGDLPVAGAMFPVLTTLLQELEDAPISQRAEIYNCRLAAIHLVAGADDLHSGRPWSSRSKYGAAVDACR